MIDSAQELKEAIVGARVAPYDHLIAVHWMKLGRAIAEIERLREEVKFVREEMVCLKAHRDELQASVLRPSMVSCSIGKFLQPNGG